MVDLIRGPQLGEFSDPRIVQRRLAVNAKGQQVWVEISGDDRLGAVNKLPGRWPDIIKARESGASIEDIVVRFHPKVPDPCRPSCKLRVVPTEPGSPVMDQVHEGPECLSFLIAACYNMVETYVQDLAAMKAKWMT